MHFFLQKKEIYTPNVIGKSLQSCIKILSKESLSLKLLHEKEDSDLTEGVILDQIPHPNQKIRPSQNIFVIVSKKPKAIQTPEFLGKNHKFITKNSSKNGIQLKIFWLKSLYPVGNCIAQYPNPEQELVDGKMFVFLSVGNESLYVVPNFKDCFIRELLKKFENYNIKIDIFHTKIIDDDHVCKDCKIVDQKPMPGSIVDLSKPFFMQIQV
ncbi:PASTA domain-containing protein [Candidatus Babeliales bacterium]|nr:PASTA domain-containing protein [Candidatus Babeliales bacterium]